MKRETERDAAEVIFGQMNDDQRRSYRPSDWRVGVSDMLVLEWGHLDLDIVLAEIGELAAFERHGRYALD